MRRKLFLFTCMTSALLITGCSEKTSNVSTAASTEALTIETTLAASELPTEQSTEALEIESEPIDPYFVYLNMDQEHIEGNGDQNYPVAEIDYPVFTVVDDSTVTPALKDSLDSYNAEYKKINNDRLAYLETSAVDNAAYMTPGTLNYATVQSYVMRSDESIVSILSDTTSFLPPAKPVRAYESINFDSQTGKRLMLEDVITDFDKLAEILADEYQAKYSDVLSMLPPDEDLVQDMKNLMNPAADMNGLDIVTGEKMDGTVSQLPFTLNDYSITFWFSAYSIGPENAGSQSITLAFDDYPDIVKNKYISTQNKYITPIFAKEKFAVSSGPDTKNISWDVKNNDYGWGYLFITVDDKEFSYEALGSVKVLNAYIVKVPGKCKAPEGFTSKDSKNLYICCYLYFDYIDEWEAHNIGSIDTSSISGALNDFVVMYGEFTGGAPVDPDYMRIEGTRFFMTALIVEGNYKVGEKGVPVPDGSLMLVSKEPTPDCPYTRFIPREDIELETVDENGEVTGMKSVKKGTMLYPIRTDSETVLDVQDDAGNMYRFEVSIYDESYPTLFVVNNREAGSLFEYDYLQADGTTIKY